MSQNIAGDGIAKSEQNCGLHICGSPLTGPHVLRGWHSGTAVQTAPHRIRHTKRRQMGADFFIWQMATPE